MTGAALAMLGTALAGGLVQGALVEPDEGAAWLSAERTGYALSGLDAPETVNTPCEDARMQPDGAWPLPIGAFGRLPDSGLLVAIDARRADCFYIHREEARVLEAVPLRFGDIATDIPGLDPVATAGLQRAVRDGESFIARGDVQSLLVFTDVSPPEPAPETEPSSEEVPDADAAEVRPPPRPRTLRRIERTPVARLVLVGSGHPTSHPDFGVGSSTGAITGPGVEHPPLDRPGALYVVSVEVDKTGHPVGAASAWPLWAWQFGTVDAAAGTLTLPGGRSRYDARVSAPLDQLGFEVEPEACAGARAPAAGAGVSCRPSAVEPRRLLEPDALWPVLPVGVSDLTTVDINATALARSEMRDTTQRARVPPESAEMRSTVLVSPGRADHTLWFLGDLREWPVVTSANLPALRVGDAPICDAAPEDPVEPGWGIVLQQNASHVDQLAATTQADAVAWETLEGGTPDARGFAIRVATAGSLDPRTLTTLIEHIPTPRDTDRSTPWARLENTLRTLGALSSPKRQAALAAARAGETYIPGQIPPLPVLAHTGRKAWVQRWALSVRAATADDEGVWLGLGDPVDHPRDRWRAALLRLPLGAFVPARDRAAWQARGGGCVRVMHFAHHWRLYESLLVRWKRNHKGKLRKWRRAKGTVERTVVPLWSDDMFRFLYRDAPQAKGGRAVAPPKPCSPSGDAGLISLRCVARTLAALEGPPSYDVPNKMLADANKKVWPKVRDARQFLSRWYWQRHHVFGRRVNLAQSEQRATRTDGAPPDWTLRSRQLRLQPQVGALFSAQETVTEDAGLVAAGAAREGEPDAVEFGAEMRTERAASLAETAAAPMVPPGSDVPEPTAKRAERFTCPLPPPPSGIEGPWPARVTLVPRDSGWVDVLTADTSLVVATDHRLRARPADPGGDGAAESRFFSMYWLVSSGSLAEMEEEAQRRAPLGELVVRTFRVDALADDACVEVRPDWLEEGEPLVVEASESFDALRRFNAERFRGRTGLLTASLWESRWVHRVDDMHSLARTALTPEATQVLDVQALIQEQHAWPANSAELSSGIAIEMLDPDNTLVVVTGGAGLDMRQLGVSMPYAFVEIPIQPDLAFHAEEPPAPIVVQSRLPWLYTPAMVPDNRSWLEQSARGSAACFRLLHEGEGGVGADQYDPLPCRFTTGDLQFDPDTGLLLLSLQDPHPRRVGDLADERRDVPQWRTYMATLDRMWFSAVATLPRPETERTDIRPQLRRDVTPWGVTVLGIQHAVQDGDDDPSAFYWLLPGAVVTEAERQRDAPCLDPSDPRCHLR